MDDNPSGEPGHSSNTNSQAARWPHHIGARRWWEILKRCWRRWSTEGFDLVAAGLAFRFLLALFPFLIILVALVTIIFSPADIRAEIAPMLAPLPGPAKEALLDELSRIADHSTGGALWNTAMLMAVSLWALMRGMRSLLGAYTLIYREQERQTMWRTWLKGAAMALAAPAVFILTLVLLAGVPFVLATVDLGRLSQIGAETLRWTLLLLLVGAIQITLGRLAAPRRKPRWSWLGHGSLFTSVLWVMGCLGLQMAISWSSGLQRTYGVVTGVVVVLLWLQMSTIILLAGAMINAESEHETAADSTVGPDRPQGERGAYMADDRPPQPGSGESEEA